MYIGTSGSTPEKGTSPLLMFKGKCEYICIIIENVFLEEWGTEGGGGRLETETFFAIIT